MWTRLEGRNDVYWQTDASDQKKPCDYESITKNDGYLEARRQASESKRRRFNQCKTTRGREAVHATTKEPDNYYFRFPLAKNRTGSVIFESHNATIEEDTTAADAVIEPKRSYFNLARGGQISQEHTRGIAQPMTERAPTEADLLQNEQEENRIMLKQEETRRRDDEEEGGFDCRRAASTSVPQEQTLPCERKYFSRKRTIFEQPKILQSRNHANQLRTDERTRQENRTEETEKHTTRTSTQTNPMGAPRSKDERPKSPFHWTSKKFWTRYAPQRMWELKLTSRRELNINSSGHGVFVRYFDTRDLRQDGKWAIYPSQRGSSSNISRSRVVSFGLSEGLHKLGQRQNRTYSTSDG
ncbi:hypothetical protein BV898_16345 [Hypsibius exemplaris]|uniref:Uncharacterized protein n=1 Tax=Hypsibius exemplaris TaxID=2072580 RepID=A0A9X6NEM4_HYPEX|nr:hypothetical protein BV898_16345 [Hypsibius exemplaris]